MKHVKMDLEQAIAAAREVTADVIAPQARETDEQARWPEQGLKALMAAGLGGLVVPRPLGGLGLGLSGLAKICQIIGEACPSTAICFGMHCVGASVLSRNPNLEQIERFITPICQGQHITSLSLSEPDSGALFYLPKTKVLQQSSGDYLVNGVKSFVTNGGHADSYVISGCASLSKFDCEEFSCYILPGDAAGIYWRDPWSGLGMRGNSSRTLELKDVQLPADHLLGRQGDQTDYLLNSVMPFFLIAMAGTYYGAATAAFEIGRNHLLKRQRNGKALAQHAILQSKLGQLWSKLQSLENLIIHAARRFDSGDPAAITLVLATKAEVADLAVNTVNEVMTLLGGIGYSASGRLAQMLRDVRAVHVMSPTTNLLYLWIGRMLLEQPIFNDD